MITAADAAALAASLSGVGFTLDAENNRLVTVSDGRGTLLLTSAGAVATLGGSTEIETVRGSPQTFAGAVTLNTTGVAVNERIDDIDLIAEAGSYLRVAVVVPVGSELAIGNLAISGSFGNILASSRFASASVLRTIEYPATP